MTLNVEIQISLEGVSGLPANEQMSTWAQAAFDTVNEPGSAESQLTLRVVDESEITRLNRDYRHKDAPTNVLSFPFDMPQGLPESECLGELGDVVICAAVVRREAARQGKSEESHWAHMVVHGTLHLLGYDHIVDAEAIEMESLEIRVLAGLGYADPYAVTEAAARS